MSSLRVLALGNGGMVNTLLPHNAVLVDGHFLLDCPHDIIRSFQTLGLTTRQVQVLFISHFHADHTFGFPMFVLDRWMSGLGGNPVEDLTVYGPRGVARKLTALVRLGLLSGHPAFLWMLHHVHFIEVKPNNPFSYQELTVTPVALRHVNPTLGLVFSSAAGRPLFAYLTDTTWCPSVAKVLRQRPRLVWIDLNGGPSGLHLSFEELVDSGLPLTGGQTRFLGTHVSVPRASTHAEVSMVTQGDLFEVEYE